MPQSSLQKTPDNKGLLKAILLAGLLVGTLDISAAIIQTLINGRNPVKMFQFIASGVFGNDSFSGGPAYAVYGLIFHYCIALGWATLFFLIYPKIKLLSKNKVATGVVYGFFVWLMMNRVILPLSNIPPLQFKWSSAIVAMMILMMAIGLPLSFLASRHYSGKM